MKTINVELSDTSKELIIDALRAKRNELLREVGSFDDIMSHWNEVKEAMEIEEDLEILTGQTNPASKSDRKQVNKFHDEFRDIWHWMRR